MKTLTSLEQINPNKLTVIKFWAAWCQPCKMMSPVYDKAEQLQPDVDFFQVDIDTEHGAQLRDALNVKTIPTGIFMLSEEKYRIVGTVALNEVLRFVDHYKPHGPA